MFGKFIALASLAALCVTAVLFVQADAQAPNERPGAERPKKWEYKVVRDGSLTNFADGKRESTAQRSENLTKLGDDGWELVSVTKGDVEPDLYFFKRPK